MKEAFKKELEQLINKHSIENGSNTPDFLLSEFIMASLAAYGATVQARDTWYGLTSNGISSKPLATNKNPEWASPPTDIKECCGNDCGCGEQDYRP